MELNSKSPDGPDRDAMGPTSLRSQAGEPGQQAQVHDHRGRHRPGRRLGRGHPGRAGLQRQVLLLPGLPAPRPLASPRRAASTPPRIITTTATASTASSTTRSRAATSARAKPTSTAWPQISVNIIDQCVAQGVPFAREYGGLLANRSFGGAQVSRTFYARGQTGQQLLLGAYQALERQIGTGTVKMYPAHARCSTWSSIDGQARGIVTRDLVTGKIESPRRPTRWCSAPAATATSSTSPPTPRAPTSPPSGARTSAARCSPTPASRRSTPPAFRSPANISPSSR